MKDEDFNIPGCTIMKMENLLSLSITYIWHLNKDYSKFYSFEVCPRMIRNDWELYQLVADEREKAIEHLLWSGLWSTVGSP